MKRCEVCLLIQSHHDFSSSCRFRLPDANFGKILASKLFHTPIFNGSFGVQRWYPIQVPVLQKPWPLLHSWCEEEGIAQVLGPELGKTGKIQHDLGIVLNFPCALVACV